MRRADLAGEFVLRQRARNPRDDIVRIGCVIDMLELAATAFGKVAAWRQLTMRTGRDRTFRVDEVARCRKRNMAAACRDAVAPSGDPDDRFAHSCSRRSSAIMPGP